jgi:hypothetical protein
LKRKIELFPICLAIENLDKSVFLKLGEDIFERKATKTSARNKQTFQ